MMLRTGKLSYGLFCRSICLFLGNLGNSCQVREDDGSEFKIARAETEAIFLRWYNKYSSNLLDMGIKEEKKQEMPAVFSLGDLVGGVVINGKKNKFVERIFPISIWHLAI